MVERIVPFESADSIFIRALSFQATLPSDAWGRKGRSQPVTLDTRVETARNSAVAEDDLGDGIDYGKLSKAIVKAVEKRPHFESLLHLYNVVSDTISKECCGDPVECRVTLPRGALLTEAVGVCRERFDDEIEQLFFIKHLKVPCVVGLNDHERIYTQEVLIDIKMPADERILNNYTSVIAMIASHVSQSKFKTLEALAESIARILLNGEDGKLPRSTESVIIAIEKPRAISNAQSPGISIKRRVISGGADA